MYKRQAQYKQNIAQKQVCADCIGLIKGFAWTNGGVGVIESIGTDKTYTSKYGGNGCPDKSANEMCIRDRYDYQFFYRNLQENVGVRLEAYLEDSIS